ISRVVVGVNRFTFLSYLVFSLLSLALLKSPRVTQAMMDLVDHLYILATYDQKFTFQDGECHVLVRYIF
ncbi:hypothetical protein LINPERPRIM_LOCUS20771, partial [Linum perenne]